MQATKLYTAESETHPVRSVVSTVIIAENSDDESVKYTGRRLPVNNYHQWLFSDFLGQSTVIKIETHIEAYKENDFFRFSLHISFLFPIK